jgi:uncharacterized membrane protein
MEDNTSMQEKEIKAIVSAIVKVVCIIALTMMVIIWGYSCGLNSEIIQECRSACNSTGSQMESVTSSECICEKTTAATSTDEWVIPRAAN